MGKNKVSAVIITFNNAETLEETLATLKWCDEIVVVDSGSCDQTKEICLQHGCCFSTHPFDGYGPQKQYATSLARNNWILSIDSDEVMSEALQQEIQTIFSEETIPYSGFEIIISLHFMGKLFRYGRESKLSHIRLYNRNYGGFSDNKLHERIVLQGEVKQLRNIIIHHSYKDLRHYFEKFNKFTSLAVEDAIRNNKKANKLQILVKFPAGFLIFYIWQRNFLNGFPGFVWSVISAYYKFVKYLKLYEALNIRNK